MEKALFGAGCFWGVQADFDSLPGVVATQVGYAGGVAERPTYEMVCTGRTGHAEVVEVEFDPSVISYRQLLAAFFSLHDPTQLNRQGPDVGTQYRSVIFAQTAEQGAEAAEVIAALNAAGARKIATTIEPEATFWPAEDYHQKYLAKRGQGSCRI